MLLSISFRVLISFTQCRHEWATAPPYGVSVSADLHAGSDHQFYSSSWLMHKDHEIHLAKEGGQVVFRFLNLVFSSL